MSRKNGNTASPKEADYEEEIRARLSDRRRLQKLDYSIHGCSGYSTGYSPERIMENNPEDQASRWSSPANDQHQFLTLSLPAPSIVATVTFGKYSKLHVCNLREFSVYAGPDLHSLVQVLHTGLRNDTEHETFTLTSKHYPSNTWIPVKYVKIVPLASHGSNFNYSIWYVELRGLSDAAIMSPVLEQWEERIDREAWRICLDFIRRHPNPVTASVCQQLTQMTGVQVEDAALQRLFEALINTNSVEQAETLVGNLSDDLLQEPSAFSARYRIVWERVATQLVPCRRGGHQMAWDGVGERLWLFGGWDGERELGDLWSFSPSDNTWCLVQEDTRHSGGPSPRSCHKIVIDEKKRVLYVLGRFVEPDQRAHTPLNSDLYSWSLDHGGWTCISEDTAQEGGPLLIYDHQMVVEPCKCPTPCQCPTVLWVYGGKVVAASPSEPVYSGLWRGEIGQGGSGSRWRMVRPDDPSQSDLTATPMLRSRIGHCMLFDEETRLLYILHGQRMKDYLSDYFVYNVDTDTVVWFEKDVSAANGPPPGFTQRGCIISPEPGTKMLLLLSGLVREKTAASADAGTAPATSGYDSTQNALWALDLALSPMPVTSPAKSKWSLLYSNANNDSKYWRDMGDKEPCPRYAHQLVACGGRHGVFLFGGNPGDNSNTRLRLDDLWRMRVEKCCDVAATKRHMLYLLRRQQFKEMCRTARRTGESPVPALQYLQTRVGQVAGSEDAAGFERLSAWLFLQDSRGSSEQQEAKLRIRERLELFEEIAGHFAAERRPPSTKLPVLLL